MSNEIHMTLNSTAPDLRRDLSLSASIGYLTALVYQPRTKRDQYAARRMMAYVHCRIDECNVEMGDDDRPVLWVGSAAFDLTRAEARAVVETFGLRKRFHPLERVAPTIEQEDAVEIEAETAARNELPTECPKCGPSCQCDIAWNE